MVARSKISMQSLPTSLVFALLATTLLVSGCGGTGAATTMIAGNVSGLSQGTSVGLENNGKAAITVKANGSFYFDGQVQGGTPYSVTVAVNPVGGSCEVRNGSGIVGKYAQDVSNIEVICLAGQGNVFGDVSGLAPGGTLSVEITATLLNSTVTDGVTLNANGPFVFPTSVPPGYAYNVEVSGQPNTQTCVVSGGKGTMPDRGSISSIGVTCR